MSWLKSILSRHKYQNLAFLLAAIGCAYLLLPIIESVRLRLYNTPATGSVLKTSTPLPLLSVEQCLQRRGSRGKWVFDWDYANRTSYPNFGSCCGQAYHRATLNFTPTPEQPFRFATAWRWADEDCPVKETSFPEFCRALHTMGVTSVVTIGDSLTMQFAKSLESLLGFPPQGRRMRNFNGALRPLTITCKVPTSFPITLWTIRRGEPKEWFDMRKPVDKEGMLLAQEFIERNPNKTVIVANLGAWIYSMKDYAEAFDSLTYWLNQLNPEKVFMFYRETIPGHWPCQPTGPESSKHEFNWIEPVYESPHNSSLELAENETRMYNWDQFHSYNAYARERLFNRTTSTNQTRKVPIHWLNIYNSAVLRRDGHVGFGDCLHYYLPGPIDHWVHFFYSALLDMAELERQRQTVFYVAPPKEHNKSVQIQFNTT